MTVAMAILILLVVGGLLIASYAVLRDVQSQRQARQVAHWLAQERTEPHAASGYRSLALLRIPRRDHQGNGL